MSEQPPATPRDRAARRPDPGSPSGQDRGAVAIVRAGTAAWAVAGLALLPFAGRLLEDGRGWLFLTCATGVVLGLLGLGYVRRQQQRP